MARMEMDCILEMDCIFYSFWLGKLAKIIIMVYFLF